jgi:hypothetical protein
MCFCHEEAKLWGENKPKLHQPNLDDLHEEDILVIDKTDTDEDRARKERINDGIYYKNKQQRQKYVDNIISPAYHYFSVIKEIECYQSNNDSFMGEFFILQPATILIMARALLELKILENFLLCIIIALIPSIVCDWIISLIYKRTPLTIKHFEVNLENLKSYREHLYNINKENNTLEYNISKESYVNYYIIVEHNKYLRSIKQTVILRSTIRKMLGGLTIIVYLFFFFTIPEY